MRAIDRLFYGFLAVAGLAVVASAAFTLINP